MRRAALVLAGLALAVAMALVWVGTARLWAVERDLHAVLPDGWAAKAVARAGRPELLADDLRGAAEAAGIGLWPVQETLYAVVPIGPDEEWCDLTAGCRVNLGALAVVRGADGWWGLGHVHCVAGRPGGVPRRLGRGVRRRR